MKLFIGIESEGMLRGMRTLFVEGQVPATVIVSYTETLRQNGRLEIQQVYFGARYRGANTSDVNFSIVEEILDANFKPAVAVTVDVRMLKYEWAKYMLYSGFSLMLSVQRSLAKPLVDVMREYLEAGLGHKIQVKFRGTAGPMVSRLDSFVMNSLTENHDDKVIWRG